MQSVPYFVFTMFNMSIKMNLNKNKYLIIALALSVLFAIWHFYCPKILKDYYNIFEWGGYLFSVPIAYCLFIFFSSSKTAKVIFIISIGVLASILLNWGKMDSFWLQKILATIVGAIITWFLWGRNRFKKKNINNETK